MVMLTIVGRVCDALPLAQGPAYINQDENTNFSSYKQQAEFILQEISRGTLSPSRMTIRIDHYSFHYLMENGICFITLCDSSYPRKLAYHYLQDLQMEFGKFDITLIDRITRPYSFVKFESIIWNIKKRYVDTRTQANLSKLNANRKHDLDVITIDMLQLIERRRYSEGSSTSTNPNHVTSIWGSPQLEVIAQKWTPITIIVVAAVVLMWASFILTDNFVISSY